MAPYARLKQLVCDGFSLEEVYITLRIPFGQLNAVAQAYGNISYQLDKERLEKSIEQTARMAREIEERKNTSPIDRPINYLTDEEEESEE